MTATLTPSPAVTPVHRVPMLPMPLHQAVVGAGNPRANGLLAALV